MSNCGNCEFDDRGRFCHGTCIKCGERRCGVLREENKRLKKEVERLSKWRDAGKDLNKAYSLEHNHGKCQAWDKLYACEREDINA